MAFKGMEFTQDIVLITELPNILETLSIDGWQLLAVTTVHANTFELGSAAHCLIVLKRPKK